MHCLRVQSQGPGAPQEGRDALCPPQTHPWPGTAPITRAMRRSRRIYPRCHRPKHPETRKAQTDEASRRLKRWPRLRHLNEIKSIPPTDPAKSKSFSTKSAQTRKPRKERFTVKQMNADLVKLGYEACLFSLRTLVSCLRLKFIVHFVIN